MPVELTGTTFSTDLDLEGGNARATFSAPGFLGLTGELIVLDGTSYLKTTLTGALYHAMAIGGAGPEPSGAGRGGVLEALTDILADPALEPTLDDDVECGSTTCYRVEIALSAADLTSMGLARLEAPAGLPIPIPLPALVPESLDLAILVAKDTRRIAVVTVNADLGPDGAAALDLTFSKWDEAVSISAPPPDQVAP